MKTLTVTAARQNLGNWLKRTLRGEDVGVSAPGKTAGPFGQAHRLGAIPESAREQGIGRQLQIWTAQTIHWKAEACLDLPFF